MKKFVFIMLLISLNAFSISYEKIGEWGFGRYQQIAMKGDIVYGISEESGISVVDYSDVDNPVKLGEFSRTDEFHNILIDGETAFVSAMGKIYITNVGNNIPETISILELDADCYRMTKVGNKLYVAGGYAGLLVVDVSDLEHPSVLGSYSDPDEEMQNVVDVAVNTNGDIYVVDSKNGLFILKTSDFKTYEEIGRMKAQMVRIKFMSETKIAISYGQNGVKFYNCENPDSLKYIGGYTQVSNISDFIIDGNVMFCADNYDGILILDITSEGSPSLIKTVPTSTICYSMVKKGNYIFTANSTGGILCVDISSPDQAYQYSSFDDSTYPVDMGIKDNYLFVADFYNGVKSLSTSDITRLDMVDLKKGKDFPSALTVKDNYLYYADSTIGLGVFKINSDGSLDDINYLELEGNFLSVESFDNFLFCAGEYGGLYVFDITDRENPVLEGRYYEFQSVVKVRVDNNGNVILSCGFNGVKVLKETNGEIVEVKSLDIDGYVLDAMVVDNKMFVTDFYAGLRVLDLDEGFNIISESDLLEDKSPESVYYAEGYLYVACGINGIYVFDLSGGFPVQSSFIETHSNAKRLLVNEDIMYVAEGLSGKIDVYKIVYEGTKVYTAPINGSGKVEIFNSCGKESLVDVAVYNNLKPVQFERVKVSPGKSVVLNLQKGDTVKCFSASNETEIAYSPYAFLKTSVILQGSSSSFMKGRISPFSFYQILSLENLSDKNGYFKVRFFDIDGKVVFEKDFFIEARDSISVPFLLNGYYDFTVWGDGNFTATLCQFGMTGTYLDYLMPINAERY